MTRPDEVLSAGRTSSLTLRASGAAVSDRLSPVVSLVRVVRTPPGPRCSGTTLAYVEGRVPVPERWWQRDGCAHLVPGAGAYADEVDRARALGWPVLVLPGAGPLHCLTGPEETAAATLSLLDRRR